MTPLELVKRTALMERSSGIPEVKIGLTDGPVVNRHSNLVGTLLRAIPGNCVATRTTRMPEIIRRDMLLLFFALKR